MNTYRAKAKKSALEWAYLILLGSLGFSMLGLDIIMNTLHFPFYFIEWLYIPAIVVYGKRVFSKLIKTNINHALIVLLLIYGLAYGVIYSGSIASITEYRSIIYLLIIYRYVKDEGISKRFDDLLYVCFIATISELFYVAIFTNRNIVSSTNCLASSIAIIGFFVIGNYKLGLLTFAISMLTGILSGYRIGIVMSAISLLVACAYIVFHGNENEPIKKKVTKFIYLFVIFIVFILFIRYYESIIMFFATKLNMDQFAVFRVTTRMRAITQMDFSQSQDGDRLRLWMMPLNDFFSSILPRGFIRTPGTYIDVPIIILYDTVGSVASWIILLFFLRITIISIKKIHRFKKCMAPIDRSIADFSIYMIPILLCLLIANGTFLKNLYQAIQTGIILGSLCHITKMKPYNRGNELLV